MAIDSVMVYHLIEEVGDDEQQDDVEGEGGDESNAQWGSWKKIAESGQLWELISPQFFAENT